MGRGRAGLCGEEDRKDQATRQGKKAGLEFTGVGQIRAGLKGREQRRVGLSREGGRQKGVGQHENGTELL